LLFLAQNAALVALLLIVPAALGTTFPGPSTRLALRSTFGLALAGQTLIVLGILGGVRPWSLCLFAAIALVAGAMRMRWAAPRWQLVVISTIAALPIVILALYPPVAFDETLYHLPFVSAIAQSGAIRFLPTARFPIFPQLHEVLCVAPFLIGGATATHLVAAVELLLLTGVVVQQPKMRMAGILAAALVVGNPIIVQLGTVTYVDVALTLFIVAGASCLDRQPAIAGVLFGSACSVKYLGCYFAVVAVMYLLLFGTRRRRAIPIFVGTLCLAMLPMYGWIASLTHNPFFPFASTLFGASPWTMPLPPPGSFITHALNGVRVFWDVSFARERLNAQPPFSPLFAVSMAVVLVSAIRNRRALFLSAVCVAYIAIFTLLPADSRYLVPLLPLVSLAAATAVTPLIGPRIALLISLISIAVGVAYAGYRINRQGVIPLNIDAQHRYQEQHIPELRALARHDGGRIYVCGVEQLKFFGGDALVGDVTGPYANVLIIGKSRDSHELALRLSTLGVRDLLLSRAHCPPAWRRLASQPQFTPVYVDDAAELWRLP